MLVMIAMSFMDINSGYKIDVNMLYNNTYIEHVITYIIAYIIHTNSMSLYARNHSIEYL